MSNEHSSALGFTAVNQPFSKPTQEEEGHFDKAEGNPRENVPALTAKEKLRQGFRISHKDSPYSRVKSSTDSK